MRISNIILFTIIGIVVLVIYMTPSANLGLTFSNQSGKVLFMNVTNMKNHKVITSKIEPNQDTYVKFISGDNTEEMRELEFYVFVYESNSNIIFSRIFTGKEIVERKVLTLDNANNLGKTGDR